MLLKSADINGDNALDIEEFISLIHSTNNALDVDLKDLAPMSDQMNKQGGKSAEILGKLQQNAFNNYEYKLDNQLKLFFQKSWQQIARDWLNEDSHEDGSKTYKIDKKKLKAILKHRLKLPEMLKNDTDRIDKIINQYADTGSEAVDYKTMLEDIRTFNYEFESGPQTDRKLISPYSASDISEHDESPRGTLTVLDIQKVPWNKEEDIKSRSNKIHRMLKLHFKNEAELTKHLKSTADIDKNGTIDLNELKTFIIGSFKNEIENSIVNKKDIEWFLSNFVYNKYGHTAVDEIGTKIFASPEEANRMVDHFRRARPPPSTVNEGLANLTSNEDTNSKFIFTFFNSKYSISLILYKCYENI